LIRYGSSITRDSETSRELVQDLFLELWEKRDTIRIKGSIKTYLYSSIYHRALNFLRALKIREIYASNPVEIANWLSRPVHADRMDPLMLELIEKQISMLPPQCREVFTRSVILGEKNADVASYMGLNINTVENHLVRARKILKEKLKKNL
jgi:RNA polymerase sigma-70 factor (ECF subfamily)